MFWKPFSEDWILYRDDDIVVVNKPCNMPVVAGIDGFDASLPRRLKSQLWDAASGENDDVSLAVASGMLASASGLSLLVVKNAGQRLVVRMCVAAVVASAPGSKRSTGRCTTERRQIELEVNTDDLEQLCTQLSNDGSPIVGDAQNGGQPASRLMLHVMRLRFTHPRSGKPLIFETGLPKAFDKALQGTAGASSEDARDLPELLERAAHRRWGLWHSRHGAVRTTAFRLFNAAGDGFDKLALDVYGDWLVVHRYTKGPTSLAPDIMYQIQGLGFRGLYLKVHPKQANTLVNAEAAGLAPSTPVWGEPAPEWLQVHEYGIPYWVRLADGLATGLYLDQRQTRQHVRAMSAGKSVLNLFAYTCAFGVSAGLGNAKLVVNVDTSKRALTWGHRNLALAGIAVDRQRMIQDDAFRIMEKYGRQGRHFDLVILDPPTYARTRRSRFSVANDYPKLLRSALALVNARGTLLACCNYGGMSLAGLRRRIHEAAQTMKIAQYSLRDCPAGVDFPGPWGEGPQLKAVEVQLG